MSGDNRSRTRPRDGLRAWGADPFAAARGGDMGQRARRTRAYRRRPARRGTNEVGIAHRVPAAGATAYGPADAAFTARHYRAAFRLYERLLVFGPASELDPQAYDAGTADLLRRALQRAGAGDAVSAR